MIDKVIRPSEITHRYPRGVRQMPNRIVLSLLAAGLCWSTPSLFAAPVARRAWIRDVDQALQEAESQQRPVLLFVSMDQCKYCRRMEQTTFRDPQVRQTIGTHFVPAVIKNSDRPDLMRELQIRSFPTTLVVSPQGEVLQQMKGYIDASKFQQQLSQLAGEPISSDFVATRPADAKRSAPRGSALPVHQVSSGRRQVPGAAGAVQQSRQDHLTHRFHQRQRHQVHPAQSGFRWPFGLDRFFARIGPRR